LNVIDENITRDQADLLSKWRIRFRSISRDLGAQGIADENIIPLLLRLKRPTFLTRDRDFFQPALAHPKYSLVWFDVDPHETAFFIRRFLRDRRFRTTSQRLGKVIRVHHQGIEFWDRWNANTQALWT
jgi:hypothetical protein